MSALSLFTITIYSGTGGFAVEMVQSVDGASDTNSRIVFGTDEWGTASVIIFDFNFGARSVIIVIGCSSVTCSVCVGGTVKFSDLRIGDFDFVTAGFITFDTTISVLLVTALITLWYLFIFRCRKLHCNFIRKQFTIQILISNVTNASNHLDGKVVFRYI